MDETIAYYNQNAEEYFNKTVNVSIQGVYDQFEAYLKPGYKILDLGCGSGRDSRYFLSKGYDVVSVDGSERMCQFAAQYLGKEVRNINFNELDYVDEFDAVWACASLLHVNIKEIIDVMALIRRSLKKSGLLYASWKYGFGKRVEGKKSCVCYNSERIKKLYSDSLLSIEKIWITEDKLNRDCKWLNVLACKDIL